MPQIEIRGPIVKKTFYDRSVVMISDVGRQFHLSKINKLVIIPTYLYVYVLHVIPFYKVVFYVL